MASINKWQFKMTKEADKSFGSLDKTIQKRITGYFEDRILPSDNPRLFGKALKGNHSGFWAYRVGDYRIVVNIEDNNLTIIAIAIDHRRQVYDF